MSAVSRNLILARWRWVEARRDGIRGIADAYRSIGPMPRKRIGRRREPTAA
jgi:hypothetical protein